MDTASNNNSNQAAELVSLVKREALLRAHVGLFDLSLGDMAILVGLMRELTIDSGEIIVAEGDIIESIYLLAAGSAEVSQQVAINNKTGTTLLAVLNEGDAIGLKSDPLFTDTGFRTVTVTALTPCILLELRLTDLNHFFETRPQLLATISNKSTWILRMKLIKEATPFSKLTPQQLAGLASGVKEIKVEPNYILFNQGDSAESCYLICSGKVEISTQSEQGTDQTGTILEPYNVVGESAFLNFAKCNSTARALTECTLLQMDKELLLEIASSDLGEDSGDPEVHDTLMILIRGHCRPSRKESIIYQHRTTADGQSITTLKNTVSNTYLQLSKEGWFIWTHLNGNLTITELAKLAAVQLNKITPDKVNGIVQTLVESGFALIDVNQSLPDQKTSEMEHPPSLMGRLFNLHYFFRKADKKISFLYKKIGFIFFKIPSITALFLLITTGILLFFKKLTPVIASIPKMDNLPLWLLFVVLISMTIQLLTPLFKALTIKHFNHEIPHLGIIWQAIGPIGIVDTSDMWLSSRWPQSAVSLSGIMTNAVLASLLSCFAFYTSNTYIMVFTWLCALFIYLQTIRTLNPILDLDGYELLCHMLDCPHLRELSMNWMLSKKHSTRNHNLEIIFWGSALFYLLMVLSVTIWIVDALFVNQHALYSVNGFILAVLILLFFVEIIIEIKNQKQLNSLQLL